MKTCKTCKYWVRYMQKYSTSSRASDTDERVGGFCESGNMSEDRGQGWGVEGNI